MKKPEKTPEGVPLGASKRRKQTRLTPAQRDAGNESALNKHWRTYFLQALAASSNVTAAAREAGVSVSRAYKARREHPGFAAQWRAALHEGYEHLEMEVLGYLRGNGGDRKLDVANAIRLLAAHRQTIAEIRSTADEDDQREVLDSIDAMIDQMRARAAANDALLAEADEDGQ